MKKLHILYLDASSPNEFAFLFPMRVHQAALRLGGIDCRFFHQITSKLFECDVLMISSKFFTEWWRQRRFHDIAAFLTQAREKTKVIWADISDSTGTTHFKVLPYVDRYIKNQLLKNRSGYLQTYYSSRIFTDYAYKKYGVFDQSLQEAHLNYIPDPSQLNKLALGWNSGLADYGRYSPYTMKFSNWSFGKALMKYPKPMRHRKERLQDISCRMGINYPKPTVCWQRQQLQKILKAYCPTTKLNRRDYLKELLNSKLVFSPFGLGEITLKDFEVFLTGGLLIKPNMHHMETWPNFYIPNETIITHDWDLTDILPLVEQCLTHYTDYRAIAEEGMNHYERHLHGPGARQLFFNHLEGIVNV